MPREIARKPRFIYPTIATSLTIAQLSALAELLFWRLLPQADDQGRLTGYPRQIKAIACPMRDDFMIDNIPELLKELEDADLIIQYSASSEPIIQIKAWWSYQAGMRRIYPSKYPPPEGWQDRVKGISGGQAPTNAPNVPPNQEVNISGNQVISKPEPEAIAPPTTAEKKIIKLLSTLKGWKTQAAEDIAWLRDFLSEFPACNLAELKACYDYYSGRGPPKDKGGWKNRFRNWMVKKSEYGRRPPYREKKGEDKDKYIKGKYGHMVKR